MLDGQSTAIKPCLPTMLVLFVFVVSSSDLRKTSSPLSLNNALATIVNNDKNFSIFRRRWLDSTCEARMFSAPSLFVRCAHSSCAIRFSSRPAATDVVDLVLIAMNSQSPLLFLVSEKCFSFRRTQLICCPECQLQTPIAQVMTLSLHASIIVVC